MTTYPMRARIRNEGTGPARIDIFDDIGAGGWFSEGYTPASFADAVKGISGPLDIHINSAGGDVSDGIAIASAIRNYPGRKRTVVDGMAASIASVIAQAGDERVVEPGAMLMVHDPLTSMAGNEADFLKTAATLGKHGDNLAAQYAARAGGTPEHWREVMRAETWYTADEAVAAGLADKVGPGAARLPQGVDVDALAARAPGRVMAALRSMPQAAAKCKTCGGGGRLKHPGTGANGMTCPGCKGSGTYDPDGDGDDDASAAGDTDRDYTEPDGSPGPKASARAAAAKPYEPAPYHRDPDENVECPVCHLFNDVDAKFCDQCGAKLEGRDDVRVLPPAAGGAPAALTEERVRAILREEVQAAAARLPAAAAAVDDSPWDAAKAWHAGAEAKDPEAFYRGICAGEKTGGDPGTQAHWALPYRYSPGSPPNAAGVRAAWAVLNGAMGGAQDLADRDAVKAKVEALMRQVNPDWKPGDSTETVFSRRLREMRGALPSLKGAQA